MMSAVRKYVYAHSETTDIGTVLPTDLVRDVINIAFEGDGANDKYALFVHERGRTADNPRWWESALSQLLPDYFS
jgi:hypothetical protein